MITGGNKMQLFSEKAGKDGAFTFLLQDFEDTLRAVVQTKNRNQNKKNYGLDLYTNYQAKPVDNYKNWSGTNNRISLPETSEQLETKIEKEVLTRELTRALNNDEFVITTDVAIEEVTVEGKKTTSDKAKITQKYGSPDHSIGKKRIRELANDKPWQFGLMSILSDAFPNLWIDTKHSSNDSSSITFQLINKERHRFFVFVDGEMIGASNVKGVLSSAFGAYTMNDLISLDPELVTSIDLIFPKNDKGGFSLNGAAERYEYQMNAYTTDGTDKMKIDLEDLAEQSDKINTPVAVLSIYTRDGAGLYGKEHYKGIANLTLHGFAKEKEFYQPNYSAENNDSIATDLRNTLAWLPNLRTDSTGKAVVAFYTSDVSNTYRVEVNGISDKGSAGSLMHNRLASIFNKEKEPGKQLAASRTMNSDPMQAPQLCLPDGSPATHALIRCLNNEWRTYTSPTGHFTVNSILVKDTAEIEISKAGYKTVILTNEKIRSQVIILEPLNETISEISVNEVLKEVFRNQNKIRNNNRFYLEGIYREQLFKEKELHQLTDYAFVQEWPSLLEKNRLIATHVVSGRRFRSPNFKENILFTPQNRFNDAVPVMEPFHADLSFLNPSLAKYYIYKMIGESQYQGRRVYHLTFDQKDDAPWALYAGQLFIDAQNFNVVWAKWRISEKGKPFLMPDEYLASGGDQATFKVINEYNEMNWSYNGEYWIPEFAISEVTFSQKDEENKIIREMAWHSFKSEVKNFKPLLPEEMDRRFRLMKNPVYHPQEWRIPWLLPSYKAINEQIKYLNEVMFYSQSAKGDEK